MQSELLKQISLQEKVVEYETAKLRLLQAKLEHQPLERSFNDKEGVLDTLGDNWHAVATKFASSDQPIENGILRGVLTCLTKEQADNLATKILTKDNIRNVNAYIHGIIKQKGDEKPPARERINGDVKTANLNKSDRKRTERDVHDDDNAQRDASDSKHRKPPSASPAATRGLSAASSHKSRGKRPIGASPIVVEEPASDPLDKVSELKHRFITSTRVPASGDTSIPVKKELESP